MYPLSVITDSPGRTRSIRAQLSKCFEIHSVGGCGSLELSLAPFIIIDVALTDHSQLCLLKDRLNSRPRGSTTVFVIDPGNRQQAAQACALGATAVLCRPIRVPLLIKALLGNVEDLASMPPGTVELGHKGISTALPVLRDALGSVCTGGPVDAEAIERAAIRSLSMS